MTGLSNIPFDVLGQVGPILTWVEGEGLGPLPITWTDRPVDLHDREREWLLRELPTYSIDNVDDIRHFARRRPAKRRRASDRPSASRLEPPPGYELGKALEKLAEHYLVWNGGELCIRQGRMEELHELALRFPVGHIVRHAHALAVARAQISQAEALELPERMSLLPSNSFGLRKIVRRGLSETHLHLSSVTSAEEHWADSLLTMVGHEAVRTPDRAEQRLLLLDLMAARILALAVLGCRDLRWFDRQHAASLLRGFDRLYFARSGLEARFRAETLIRHLRRLTEEIAAIDTGEPGRPERRFLRIGSTNGDLDGDFWLLRIAMPDLHQAHQALRGGGTETLALSARFQIVRRLHLEAHTQLLRPRHAASAAVRRRQDEVHLMLHGALYRYLVCRAHHWQQATMSGRTTGLRNFRRYFKAKERQLASTTREEFPYNLVVMRNLAQWRGLRDLEARIAPPESSRELTDWLLAFSKLRSSTRLRQLGLLVHFQKEDESAEDRPLETPGHLRLRWGTRRRKVRRQGYQLYRLMAQPEPWAPFIVGIDACNIELATPPEVFAPVFRFLRDLPIELHEEVGVLRQYQTLRPAIRELVRRRRLGMTYHVGEEFRHLLSGLRAIDEVIDFLRPQPGDRLGHATALALSPQHWAEQSGFQAIIPKLEWLDTLAWVHHLLGPGNVVIGQLGIEDEIQRLGWEIYADATRRREWQEKNYLYKHAKADPVPPDSEWRLEHDWSPLVLHDAWRLRQLDPYSLDLSALQLGKLEMGEPRGHSFEDLRWFQIQRRIMHRARRGVGSRDAFILLALYWLDPSTRKTGEQLELVDMRPRRDLWLELCRQTEAKMKQKVLEKELVVEVNPSSNRIIGPMARFRQHHVFNLTLDREGHLKRGVRVSVNTDNPATCNTSLSHEFYLLGEILLEEGVPETEVVRWLDWLRRNGKEYSFVRRIAGPDDPNMAKVLRALETTRPTIAHAEGRGGKLDVFWQRFHDTSAGDEAASEARAKVADRELVDLRRRLAQREEEARREGRLHRNAADQLSSAVHRAKKDLGLGPKVDDLLRALQAFADSLGSEKRSEAKEEPE